MPPVPGGVLVHRVLRIEAGGGIGDQPARLADLYDREERFSVLADDLGTVEAAVRAHARRNAA